QPDLLSAPEALAAPASTAWRDTIRTGVSAGPAGEETIAMTTHHSVRAGGPRAALRRTALVLAILLLAALAACSPSAGPPLPGPAIPDRAAEPGSASTPSAPVQLTEQDVETWLDGRL